MRILEPNKRVTLSAKYESESYSFEADIADPSTELDIEIGVAKRLGGASLESIPNTTYGYIFAITTLDHVIKEIPPDFPIEEIVSFEQIRDKEFVLRLFNEYKKKESWFRSELKKNRDARRTLKRKEPARSFFNEGVSNTTEGGKASGESISRTKEVFAGGDVESGSNEYKDENPSFVGEKTSGEDEIGGVFNEHKPDADSYPGRRGRVFTRRDPRAR